MLANKLLERVIAVNEKQSRKADVANRLLGLIAKVKPGNLNSASSVPASQQGTNTKEDNDRLVQLTEYTKLSSDSMDKLVKVMEEKFGLFSDSIDKLNDNLKEQAEPKVEPEIEKETPKKLNFFQGVEKDISDDYKRVKENILDFIVPGRKAMMKEQDAEKKDKKKPSNEPKRPKVIPLVATPSQTNVSNTEQKQTFDVAPIIKAMDKNTIKLLDKLDELRGTGGGGGSLTEGLLGGAAGAAATGAIKKGASAAGRMALAAAPTLAAGAVAVAGGAAVDYGLGKMGVGKDEQGNDIKINEAQDEANWQKMTTGQKIQSGIARGVEKVGDFLFLGNMARQARADRVKKETEYLTEKSKDIVSNSESSTQIQKTGMPEKVDINFNEKAFAEKDPENYKKFVEFRNQRTEEIYKEDSKKYKITETSSPQRVENIKELSQQKAKVEAVKKFKDQIEAAGAGSVTIKNGDNTNITPTQSSSNVTNTQSSNTTNVAPTQSSSNIVSSNPSVVNVSQSSVSQVPSPMSTSAKEIETLQQQETASNKSMPPIVVNNVNNAAPQPQGGSTKTLPSISGSRNVNSTIENVMFKNAFPTLA